MATRTSPSILLVEDEAQLLDLLASVLQHNNFTVHTCGRGEDALEIFGRLRDDIGLVVTDLGLPTMTGLDLIAALRRESNQLKIIAVSGFGGPAPEREALDAGANLFVVKPFSSKDILNIVTETLAA